MIIDKNNYHLFIDAKKINIGTNVHVGEGTKFIGINGPIEYVEIGDNVYFDSNIFVMTPEFRIGDYSKIYKNCRISGYKPCIIGHNFWCDQNTILNCTDSLLIGNNVGIGAYSQLWTHIKHGDVLEGCKFNSTKSMVIEDDVWFVGHCVVAPIHAKKKSMAMVGSVITKDMQENHIYGGSPAIDLTSKIGGQFVENTIEKKLEMMNAKLIEFAAIHGNIVFENLEVVDKFPMILKEGVSYFNVVSRSYTKTLSLIEIKFMNFLLPLYKFTPQDLHSL